VPPGNQKKKRALKNAGEGINGMAVFYLVRHGEADYDHMLEKGFWGFGRDFAPLSPKGRQQAETAARDGRLKSAEIIVSSPYTRALQTAQIISTETGIRVEVEVDLHEWEPDQDNLYTTSEESFAFAREFTEWKGEYPPGVKFRWETLTSMRQRMRGVADRYSDYSKVILVGHGMAFRCLTYIEKMHPGEIVECIYRKGQPECEYSFT
jgi:broad specificity phosphatase PhoE